MSSRSASRPAPAPAVNTPPASAKPSSGRRTPPKLLRPILVVLAAIALMSMFTGEMGDPDTWFHLRAGAYIWHQHKLPIPDPFSWTTYLGKPAYPEEYATRDLNLKHEWLGQVVFYLIYAMGGAPALILFRAGCVAAFCGMVGLIVFQRTGGFYLALAAAFAAATLARGVAVDRLYVLSYFLLALTLWLMERRQWLRRWLWILPPLFVFWANFHGGYFIGWVVLGAYCGEALIERLRGRPLPDERRVWAVSVISIVASGLNPAFFGVLPGMLAYRHSFLQNTLNEWRAPALWRLSWFSVWLAGAAAVLLWARGRARPADWLLFLLFGAASMMALRNVIFIGLIAPIVIATYLPTWARVFPTAAALLAVYGVAPVIVHGTAFQLRVADWKYPTGAVGFLKQHNVRAPMFNLYEYGGYLMWALWPQEKTFVDGRALNESVYRDYRRIAYNMRTGDGVGAQELLDQYGVQVILMEGFDSRGTVCLLAPSLADPAQTKWKLVYQDDTAMVFMRQPPPGVSALPPQEVLGSMEAQCTAHLQHEPELTRCARGLGDLYVRLGNIPRAKQWLAWYMEHKTEADPEIERLYQQVNSGSFGR